ncbi:hypothetical protein ACFW04_012359 [Cataglyphis niger]
MPEERVNVHAVAAPVPEMTEPEELTRFSSLNRLVRVTAWCRRWKRALAAKHQPPVAASLPPAKDTLSASECDDARLAWIRVVQTAAYKEERRTLARGAPLPSRNSLIKLTPFTDPLGILRVGGRIKHALLAYDERHPAILPGSSHLTQLIVEACHRRTMHGGVQLTFGTVRQHYWIPRGRQLVKAIIQRCVTCARWRGATQQQIMGDLPRLRVTPARPFLRTGVVSDYSADAFLAALRRFTARRGLCRSLQSDCGINFVGADAQLRAFFTASNPAQRRIADQLANDRIQWRFNPPSAPHFGSLWEAAVKSLKHHLRRVLGESTLTYEEMSTLLTQIEACMNSRPLQALSDDPDDLTALTPGHFLVGTALNALPEPCLVDAPIGRLSLWQLLQKMRDHFWDRWSREYLHSLGGPSGGSPTRRSASGDSASFGATTRLRHDGRSPGSSPLSLERTGRSVWSLSGPQPRN